MPPIILDSIPMAEFLATLLDNPSQPPGQIHLIVCLSHAAFIRTLVTEPSPAHALLRTTLTNLAAAPQVQLHFCPAVPVLLAHLSTLQHQQQQQQQQQRGTALRIYLLHPLRLHMHTPAWSAQGLARTFAALSDAASRTGAQVRVMEPVAALDVHDDGGDESGLAQAGGETGADPWDVSVPMLASVGKFAGQRGWVGRTVSAGRVAGRWCRFERRDDIADV